LFACPITSGCSDSPPKQQPQTATSQALLSKSAGQQPDRKAGAPSDSPAATVAFRPSPLPTEPKADHDYLSDELKPRTERDWADRPGKFHVKASLLDVANGIARLQQPEKVVRVPVDKLSDDDFAFIAAAGVKSEPRTLTGKVIGVHDGDTIILLDEHNRQHKIRLASIDAPEKNQAFGQRAREALSHKIFQKQLRITWREYDKYGRTIGDLYLDDRWINKEMVQEGWAWHYTKYSDSKELADAETTARKSRSGLWEKSDAEPPWEFRHKEKDRPPKPIIRAERSTPAPKSAIVDRTPSYSSDSSSGGDVQVRGYYRKNGTYVQPHTRSRPSR
jgi:endonuclease YncB( thermonuclease family)